MQSKELVQPKGKIVLPIHKLKGRIKPQYITKEMKEASVVTVLRKERRKLKHKNNKATDAVGEAQKTTGTTKLPS